MPTMYIIAGCNGAGKTTASLSLLPDVLKCKEFVNADYIAAGLSPLNPERYSFEAGRIMIRRMDELIDRAEDFAIETTLSSRQYQTRIQQAHQKGFQVVLIFFWLQTVQLAKKRVRERVRLGGHSIPPHVIERRYYRGLRNFFSDYINLVDAWFFIDNSSKAYTPVANMKNGQISIFDLKLWKKVNQL